MDTKRINIKEVIEKNDFDSLLKGLTGLSMTNKYAEMPTDTSAIIQLIKEYYLSTNDETVWNKLQESLINLCQEKDFIFLVPLYVHSYLYVSKELNILSVNIELIRNTFTFFLSKYSSYLHNNNEWIGKNIDGGLLGYIEYIAKLIKNDFDIDLQNIKTIYEK